MSVNGKTCAECGICYCNKETCLHEIKANGTLVTEEWLKNHGFQQNNNEWYRNCHGFQLRIGYDALRPGKLGTISMLPPQGNARIHCPTFYDADQGHQTVRVEYLQLLLRVMGEDL